MNQLRETINTTLDSPITAELNQLKAALERVRTSNGPLLGK